MPRIYAVANPDEICADIGGVKCWLWRAVDEHGAVLNVLLREHRDTPAAKSFFHLLLGEYDVPEVLHTDKLWSSGAALRELPLLHTVGARPGRHHRSRQQPRCFQVPGHNHLSTVLSLNTRDTSLADPLLGFLRGVTPISPTPERPVAQAAPASLVERGR